MAEWRKPESVESTAPADTRIEAMNAEFHANLAARARETLGHKLLTGSWKKQAEDPTGTPLERVLAGERLDDPKRGKAHADALNLLPAAVRAALEEAMNLTLEEMELHMSDCVQRALKRAVQKGNEDSKADATQVMRATLSDLRQRIEDVFAQKLVELDVKVAEITTIAANFEAIVARRIELFELEYGAPARSEA